MFAFIGVDGTLEAALGRRVSGGRVAFEQGGQRGLTTTKNLRVLVRSFDRERKSLDYGVATACG